MHSLLTFVDTHKFIKSGKKGKPTTKQDVFDAEESATESDEEMDSQRKKSQSKFTKENAKGKKRKRNGNDTIRSRTQ